MRTGPAARMPGAYGPARVIPPACALKPPPRAVMTTIAPSKCNAHAAP